MGKLKRMTVEEYENLKENLEEAEKKYQKAKKERDDIKKRIRWYEESQSRLSMKYKEGRAYKMFGKRAKDLSVEEKQEYNRIMAQESRNRIKRGEDIND